jgi:hypothetical protein
MTRYSLAAWQAIIDASCTKLGNVRARRRGPAADALVAEEHLADRQLDAVRHADVADHRAQVGLDEESCTHDLQGSARSAIVGGRVTGVLVGHP